MKKLFSRVFLGLFLLLFSFPPAKGQGVSRGYELMLSSLYKNTVPTLSPGELAVKLKQQPSDILLLDIRTPSEYSVSHINSARFLHFDKVRDQELQRLPKNKTLVVYCSVGYRSERIGERLKALGYPAVYNLYGGIFQWVNEGLPIVNAQGPTNKVHAYSKKWGIWLNKGEKAYE
ncbi:rhodanese-like domain-containing protein [Rufibacter tibetensis]|uniref:Rhodanese domain-containing protein n=1 Tax=Rufibacter tibetensis TaxID=512763 RepID=A0A0P0C8M0_9BACT|nr:rhodanese-like domain-containing protein [Rufibacter tibetensis]ALI97683.1 hypothetical protein DC20_00085 [Rufibacter tibetensis]